MYVQLTHKKGVIKLMDVELFPNLAPAFDIEIPCIIEEQVPGCYLYHVKASTLVALGCDLEDDDHDWPFYSSEVEVITKG